MQEHKVVRLTRPKKRVVIESLDKIDVRPIDWLWPKMIPLGALTLVVGDGGAGKGTILGDVAARITTQMAMPGCKVPSVDVGQVLISSPEESLGGTLKPRIEEAGGNPEFVRVIRHVAHAGTERSLSIRQDIKELRKAIDKLPLLRAIIIDPLVTALGTNNTASDVTVRSALGPLLKLADERNFSVIGVVHLSKSETRTLTKRVHGSTGFVNSARSVIAVHRMPGDRFVAGTIKANLAPLGRSFSGAIEQRKSANSGGHDSVSTVRIAWDDFDPTLDINLIASGKTPDPAQSMVQQAVDELMALRPKLPMPATAAIKSLKRTYSKATLSRAKSIAGVRSKKAKHEWVWTAEPMPDCESFD